MEIDVIATVVTPAVITHIEVFRGEDVIAAVVLGDVMRLAFEGGALDVIARRATWMFTTRFDPPAMPDPMPPELVPLLSRGATGFRQRVVRAGDRLRLRGAVERAERYDGTFVACGPIRLDEALRFE